MRKHYDDAYLNKESEPSVTFSDVVPRVFAKRKEVYWGTDGFHPDDYVLDTGEIISNHGSYIKKLYVKGRCGGADEPYCGGLFIFWKEFVGDLKNYPISYITMQLFSIRLPSNLKAVPNQADI
jgi:hypothetical protein